MKGPNLTNGEEPHHKTLKMGKQEVTRSIGTNVALNRVRHTHVSRPYVPPPSPEIDWAQKPSETPLNLPLSEDTQECFLGTQSTQE